MEKQRFDSTLKLAVMLRNPFPHSRYFLNLSSGPYGISSKDDSWPPILPSSRPGQRVMKGIRGVVENLSDTVAIMPLDPMDLSRFRGIMLGPKDTPIEDYILFLHIGFPTDPFLPPKYFLKIRCGIQR